MANRQPTTNNKQKVFLGLSGGVDSAVSAALLKQQGFDVTGVFIKVWHPDFLPCKWKEERRDAIKVCLHLDIPFVFMDFEVEYKKGVADYMIEEYKKGRTPNPDVLCNREVKFGAFWQKAKEMGADFIATGHYARVSEPVQKTALSSSTEDVRSTRADALRDAFPPQVLKLLEGKDKEKDQSYFLWTLTQSDLAHTLFPVGSMEKSEVRELARKFKLPVAEKKDSQGICFIGEVSLEEFLSHFITTKKGNVLNTKGEVIGTHNGALYYTIGERHGFDVTKKDSDDGAYYIVSKSMSTNTITVSNKQAEISSMSPKKIILGNTNWIIEPTSANITARIRYRGEKIPVELDLVGKDLVVEFKTPQKGLSLGQSIVFYSGEKCLGGAVMDKALQIPKA